MNIESDFWGGYRSIMSGMPGCQQLVRWRQSIEGVLCPSDNWNQQVGFEQRQSATW